MPEQKLQFENARIVQQLYNQEPKNLDLLKDQLGLKIITRDDWIVLEGTPESIELGSQFFNQLESTIRSGNKIRDRDFEIALQVLCTDGVQVLKKLHAETLITSPQKAPITPKTLGQQKYIECIREKDVVFGIGPAGTGKTYLAMAMAVTFLKQEKVSRIILTRPAVEAGEELGFLPGDLYEKISPYLRPLHDALYDMLPAEEVQKHMQRGTVEIAPLAYMRGRTMNHSMILLDEAQNCTTEQMFMFLTRLGHHSKAVITGDPTQIDLPQHKKSGLIEALKALESIPEIGKVKFEKKDVVRHRLVQKIIAAYESWRGTTE
ncbi:MAG TPA: PhoH family protein [Verrucomicrobiales bacterium]|nr:PhoH family protein [Verrucomicrobiales bacterium]